MTIKAKNLLRALLLFPYFVWGIAALFSGLVYGAADDTQSLNIVLDALEGAAAVFSFGIIIWGIPYTTLVVGLFFWSRKKPAPAFYKAITFSPILLSILITVEIVVLISLGSPSFAKVECGFAYALIASIPTLVIGYLFVGVATFIFKTMHRMNLIRTETESDQV